MKITKAVIPIAGLGSRFLPITKTIPKEMLPIVDKPTIDYIVNECVNSGIKEILFITSKTKKSVEDYFDDSFELEQRIGDTYKLEALKSIKEMYKNIKIYFIRQKEPLGSGDAINLAKEFVNGEYFAVLYGDDLMYSEKVPVLKQLINLHETKKANIIAIREVKREETVLYGMVDADADFRIKKIVEKPNIEDAPSNLAGVGRYIISSNIFPILDKLKIAKNNEYQFTDAMDKLMQEESFYGCKFEGIYYDTGSKLGYLKANIDYALRRDDLKDKIKEYIRAIK